MSRQLVISAAGAVVGYFASGGNPAGAQWGWALGGVAAAATAKPQQFEGPKINDLRVTGTEYGQPIAWAKGHPPIAGQIWWASDRRRIAHTTEQGGKGGPSAEVTNYTYEVDLLIGLTDNVIAGVARIWSNGKLLYNVHSATSAAGSTPGGLAADAATLVESTTGGNSWRRMTVYTGSSSQGADPTIEAALGVGNVPAYRGRGSVFLEGFNLGPSGQIPNLTFEIFTTGVPAGIGYTDTFLDGLGAYTAVLGSISAFSTATEEYGASIIGAGRINTTSADAIRRSITSVTVSGVRVKFRIGATTPDDAVALQLRLSGAVTFSFIPRRETAFDALSRPLVHINGTDMLIGAASLVASTWYQLHVTINGASSTVTVVRLSDNASIISATLPGTHSAVSANQLQFFDDQTTGNATIEAHYADLELLPTAATAADETVQSVVSALCLRAGLTAGQIDVTDLAAITTPVRGMAVGQAASTRAVLEVLGVAYHFEAVLSDKLYFRRRGASTVATIPYADLGASINADGDPEPLALKPGSELELPAGVAVRYMNVDIEGTSDVQQADRGTSASRTINALELPLLLTPAEAKAIAESLLLDMMVGTTVGTRISLLGSYARLEPTDCVVATAEDGSTFRLRLGRKTDAQGVLSFDAVLDDASVFTQAGVTSASSASATSITALGDTELVLMDMPILRDADNDAGYYAAAHGDTATWPGAGVFVSTDDVLYTQQASISEAAVFGLANTTLADWTGGNVFDETNTLTVNVGLGTLASDTAANLLNSGTNAMRVGSEVIQFRTAALVSAGVYTLSGLLRGRRGTESFSTGHAAGERVVALKTTGLRRIPVTTSEIGAARYVKGVTFGRTLGTALQQTITPAALGLKPFAGVDLRAARDVASADIVLTWSRRTRLAENFNSSTHPLGEATEAYEAEAYTTSGFTVLKRTFSGLTTPTFTYTSAQQVADFGSNQATVHLRVYQLSAVYGRGYALQGSV